MLMKLTPDPSPSLALPHAGPGQLYQTKRSISFLSTLKSIINVYLKNVQKVVSTLKMRP